MEFIKACWRGELSLVFTYWVMGVIGNFTISMLDILLDSNGYYDVITETKLIFIWAYLALTFVYAAFTMVSIWRSAGKYIDASYVGVGRFEKKPQWGYLAKFGVVIGWGSLFKQGAEIFGGYGVAMDKVFVGLILFVVVIGAIYKIYNFINSRKTSLSINDDVQQGQQSEDVVAEQSDEEDEEAEDLDRQAQLVEKIKLRCHYAKGSAEGLGELTGEDLKYEKERYEEFRNQVLADLSEIEDEFYRGFAIHQIIGLLLSAEETGKAKELFSEIHDEFLMEQITKDHPIMAPNNDLKIT